MNSLLAPIEVKHLLACASQPDAVTLGMPHLAMTGLSETWLLKDCGHRHWAMLAAAGGLLVADFRDPAGEPIYAAFLSVSVREAAFERAREHDRLVFTSRLTRISRARFTSVHRVAIADRPIGEVAMTSAFVRRAERGRNRSIVRTEAPALRHVTIAAPANGASSPGSSYPANLLDCQRDARIIDHFVVDPCPSQDFNGADFLYFASYPSFVDRAEWAFFRPRAPFATTRSRDIVYRGNIDPGERVIVSLLAFSREPRYLAHRYHLTREHDHSTIAEVVTCRALSRDDDR